MSAAGAGAVSVNFPGLPEYEQKKSTDTTSAAGGGTTTQALSPVQQQALDQQASAFDAQKAGTQEIADQAKANASIEAQGAAAELAAAQWKQDQLTSPAAYDADIAVARARQNVQDQQARYAAMPAPALFADRKGWDKAKGVIALLAGGISDAVAARAAILAHQSPPTTGALTRIIDMDIERQKANIDKLKDSVVMARTGLTDAEDARRQLRGDIDLKAMAMVDNAKKLTAMRLANQKIGQADIDQHQAILALDQKKADYKSEYVKGLTTSIQSRWDKSTKAGNETTNRSPTAGAGGGGVEADKNAANFAVLKNHGERLAAEMPSLSPEDIKAINRVMTTDDWISGKGTVSAIAAAAGIDPETGVSSRAKAYLDSAHRAAEGLGRVQSGAAIGTEEGKRFMQSLTPKISDTPKDLEMRAKNIREDINARGEFMARAPRNPGGVPPGQAAPAAAAPAPVQRSPQATALIAKLKAQPALRGSAAAKTAMKKFGVTEDDLK